VVSVHLMLQELYKVRTMLNKLTYEKFHRLLSEVQALPTDRNVQLKGVINLIEAAICSSCCTEMQMSYS
jgi:hypothetical protein